MNLNNKAFLVRGGISIVIFGVLLVLLIPRMVSRLGYALPSKDGIPCRIFYKERAYFGPQQCDRDFAYQSQLTQLPCRPGAEFVDGKKYQFVQVGEVPTVLGSPYPIFTSIKIGQSTSGITTPTCLFLLVDKGCYIGYGLSGGP